MAPPGRPYPGTLWNHQQRVRGAGPIPATLARGSSPPEPVRPRGGPWQGSPRVRRGSCPVLPPDEREDKVGPARQARIGVSRLGKAGHGKAWHGLAGRGGAGYGRRGKARRVVAGPGKVRLGRRGEALQGSGW